MYEVDDLFPDDNCVTQVWVSARAAKEIAEHNRTKANPPGALLKKLRRYARTGFAHYEGDEKQIRHEGDGVYRIGQKESLFRIIGFYEDDDRCQFTAIATRQKRGQELSAADRKCIRMVARVKREKLWKKRWTGDKR